jgi:hypothetical protein
MLRRDRHHAHIRVFRYQRIHNTTRQLTGAYARGLIARRAEASAARRAIVPEQKVMETFHEVDPTKVLMRPSPHSHGELK